MSTSWVTSQHLLYAVPVVVVVGLLLLKMLIRLAVVVAVVLGAGFLVLGPPGAHLPPAVREAVHSVSGGVSSSVSGAVLPVWRALRGLTG